MNILLVEDEPLLASEISELLSSFGYSVTVTSSAEQALQTLTDSDDFDVVASDMKMPGMSGLDFIRFARKKFFSGKAGVRFILMSGHLDALDPNMNLADEDISFLQKPVSGKELLARIEPGDG
ncbi:MAG: response regulator [Halioglobus sp.]